MSNVNLGCHRILTHQYHFTASVLRSHACCNQFGSTRGVARHVKLPVVRSTLFVRSVKTKTAIPLDHLPKPGITASLEPILQMERGPEYPTVVLQARSNMLKFENCVLLTRVGGFYELYFEHADKYGPVLNLKVAQKKTVAGPVSMVCYPKPSTTDTVRYRSHS